MRCFNICRCDWQTYDFWLLTLNWGKTSKSGTRKSIPGEACLLQVQTQTGASDWFCWEDVMWWRSDIDVGRGSHSTGLTTGTHCPDTLTYSNLQTHSHLHTDRHTHTYTQTDTLTPTHRQTHSHLHTDRHTHTYTDRQSYTYTQTDTLIHRHRQTHTPILTHMLSGQWPTTTITLFHPLEDKGHTPSCTIPSLFCRNIFRFSFEINSRGYNALVYV